VNIFRDLGRNVDVGCWPILVQAILHLLVAYCSQKLGKPDVMLPAAAVITYNLCFSIN